MAIPRVAAAVPRLTLLATLSVLSQFFIGTENALARQTQTTSPDVERGLRLYESDDMKGAASAFRAAVKKRRDDHIAWLNLGRALMWQGDYKESLKAYDAAIKLSPGLAAAHAGRAHLRHLVNKPREAEESARRALELDEKQLDARFVIGALRLREGALEKAVEEAEAIIKADAGAAGAYALKARALVGLYETSDEAAPVSERPHDDDAPVEQAVEKLNAVQIRRLKEAIAALGTYIRLKPNANDAREVHMRLEALRSDLRAGARMSERVYKSRDVTTKAVILSRPHPDYSTEDLNKDISGVIRLRAVLAADGKVKNIKVLRSMPYGLTEKAIAVASKIKFKPATKDGKPVSQWVTLEYYFSIR